MWGGGTLHTSDWLFFLELRLVLLSILLRYPLESSVNSLRERIPEIVHNTQGRIQDFGGGPSVVLTPGGPSAEQCSKLPEDYDFEKKSPWVSVGPGPLDPLVMCKRSHLSLHTGCRDTKGVVPSGLKLFCVLSTCTDPQVLQLFSLGVYY